MGLSPPRRGAKIVSKPMCYIPRHLSAGRTTFDFSSESKSKGGKVTPAAF
jgi:hypothetical protein